MASPTTCTITYIGLIRRIVGQREEVLTLSAEATLGELFHEISARHGSEIERYLFENGELAGHATVLVNGRNAHGQGGLAAKLGDHSPGHVEIIVLGPPVAGG